MKIILCIFINQRNSNIKLELFFIYNITTTMYSLKVFMLFYINNKLYDVYM